MSEKNSPSNTLPTLKITVDLLVQHFRVFKDPAKPLGIGTQHGVFRRLVELYPEHEVRRRDVDTFLGAWVKEPVYLEAVERSRAEQGEAVRYTLYGKQIDEQITAECVERVKKAKEQRQARPKKTPGEPILTFAAAVNKWGLDNANEREILGYWLGYLCYNINREIGVTQALIDEVRQRSLILREESKKAKAGLKKTQIKTVVVDQTDISVRGRPIIKLKPKKQETK